MTKSYRRQESLTDEAVDEALDIVESGCVHEQDLQLKLVVVEEANDLSCSWGGEMSDILIRLINPHSLPTGRRDYQRTGLSPTAKICRNRAAELAKKKLSCQSG